MTLANLGLIMPYQTADCERGFSCQNGNKSSRRSRMEENKMNTLLTIKIEGGALNIMTTMMKQSTVGGKKKQEEHKLYSSYQSHKTNHLING